MCCRPIDLPLGEHPRKLLDSLGLTAVLFGFVLRGWRFWDLGLSHFDEGQYAFARVWPWVERFDADQALFSPPLFPFLVGLVDWLVGAPLDLAGPIVSLIAGTAVILLAWWVGREWFGPATGAAAAWFSAFDPMQIAFARVGLTDALFSFLLLLSLYLFRKAMSAPGWAWTFVAGLAGGFTWSCKYSGFLPILLSMGWLASPAWRRRLPRFAVASMFAGVCVLPWFLAVETNAPGGFAALVAHQRGYATGWLGIASARSRAWEGYEYLCSFNQAVALGYCALITTMPLLALWKRSAGEWFGLSWIWLVLTQLPGVYAPYLRLWLPTELLLVIFGCAGATAFSSAVASGVKTRAVPWMLLAVGFCWSLNSLSAVAPPAVSFTPSGYRKAADELIAEIKRLGVRRVFVFARPPLLYYLSQRGAPFFRLSGDPAALASFGPNDLLVVDHILSDVGKSQNLIAGLDEVKRLPIQPSAVALLDDYAPTQFPRTLESYDVRLLMVSRPD